MGPSSTQSVTDGLHVENGKYQDALERCQNRLQQFTEDSIEAADIYCIMGGIYAEYMEDRDKALFYLEKAIDIHQKQEDEIGLALDYTKMSKIYIYIDENREIGLKYLENAEMLFKKHGMGNAFGLAEVYIQKAHLYIKAKKYEEAMGALNQAQDIYVKRYDENIVINRLKGEIYLKMQEYHLAIEQYQDALMISRNLNEQYNIGILEFELGRIYSTMNEFVQAIEHYQKALDIFIQNENSLKVAKTYNNMAYSYAQLKEIEKALELSVRACQIIEKVTPVTNALIEDKKILKHNVNMYYKGWSNDMSEEVFEAWYREVVLEGKEWDR